MGTVDLDITELVLRAADVLAAYGKLMAPACRIWAASEMTSGKV